MLAFGDEYEYNINSDSEIYGVCCEVVFFDMTADRKCNSFRYNEISALHILGLICKAFYFSLYKNKNYDIISLKKFLSKGIEFL